MVHLFLLLVCLWTNSDGNAESNSLPPRFQIRIRSSDLTEEEECFLTSHGYQGTHQSHLSVIAGALQDLRDLGVLSLAVAGGDTDASLS